MFRLDTLKQSYVGIVHIYDLKSKKVLLRGGGHFDVENRKLDVLFDIDKVYKDVEWVPVLQTEQGFFCPAQSSRGHLIGSNTFTHDHRSRLSMSSFFHWKAEKGIDHITETFDTVVIDVAGRSGATGVMTFPNGEDAQMTSIGKYGDIEDHNTGDLAVQVKSTYLGGNGTIQQRVRFIITATTSRFTRTDWVSLANAFRLYWLFQHDRTNCETLIFRFGDDLDFVTDIMQLRGYDDSTDLVEAELHIEKPMNAKLLADTTDFFMNKVNIKGHGGIEFGFYRLLGYRLGTGTKRLGDDLLDLVFALDGFCADMNKSVQRKLSKAEKADTRASIQKVLEVIEQIKDTLDPRVYEFYNKPTEKILDSITRKPYKESVQLCFETLGMDYSEYEDVISEVDTIRQLFVHGKGYNTDDLAKKIYTHGVTTINEAVDSGEMQILFGQKAGLSEKYYKLVRRLFMSYFVRPAKLA